MSEYIRLNKFLAGQLGIARREADEFIAAGRVRLNGQMAELGARVTDETDKIELDGQLIVNASIKQSYIMLNKPIGYVCSRRRQGDTPTIYELLPREYHPLKTVGRLDKDSSGLLLLTSDGDFAHQMTHPKFQKEKIYEVVLDRELENNDKVSIVQGINVENYTSRLKLSNIVERIWRVNMAEGRNRQIRRTFAALGYEVVGLHRIAFGDYRLEDLKPGEFKEIESSK